MNGKRIKYGIAVLLVYGYLVWAAWTSFGNIIGLARDLGVAEGHVWTSPLLVDGLVLMGKLLRTRGLTVAAHRYGLKLMVAGGVLSLAANVFHGHTWGDRAYGAVLVIGFVLVEIGAEHLAMEPAPVAAAAGKRCEPGCACGKHKPRRKAAPKRRTPKAPGTVAGLEKQWQQVAPQSPAMA